MTAAQLALDMSPAPVLPVGRKREQRMLDLLRAANGAWVTSGALADNYVLSASQSYQRLREYGFPVESRGRGGMGAYRLVVQ